VLGIIEPLLQFHFGPSLFDMVALVDDFEYLLNKHNEDE
jgi:hypothetical protein